MESRLVITIDEAYIGDMNRILAAISQRCNKIIEIYPFGVLIINGEAEEIDDLKKIKGIEAVTIEENFHLPSPRSDLQ